MSNCLLYDSCHTAVEPARYSCASPDDLAKSRNLWDVHRPLNNITLGEVKMSQDDMLVCLRGAEGLRKKEMAVGRFGKSALGNSEGTWSSSTPREAPAQLLQLTCFHNRNEVDRQSCICCATTHSDGSGFNAVRISGACRCNFLRAPQACGRRQDSTRPPLGNDSRNRASSYQGAQVDQYVTTSSIDLSIGDRFMKEDDKSLQAM